MLVAAAQAMLLRKAYVEAYTRCLEAGQVGGDEEVAAMDDQLNEATILVFAAWRMPRRVHRWRLNVCTGS